MKTLIEISNPYLAASGISTPSEHLCWLVFHEDHVIRMRVADNPNSPVACLAQLANDESHEVRICVAENPLTPVLILEMLSEDNHADVRYAMAENANLPAHILDVLAGDENPYVAARAQQTLKRIEEKQFPNLYFRNCA